MYSWAAAKPKALTAFAVHVIHLSHVIRMRMGKLCDDGDTWPGFPLLLSSQRRTWRQCLSAPVPNHHHHHYYIIIAIIIISLIITRLTNNLGQLPIDLHDAPPVHVVGWKKECTKNYQFFVLVGCVSCLSVIHVRFMNTRVQKASVYCILWTKRNITNCLHVHLNLLRRLKISRLHSKVFHHDLDGAEPQVQQRAMNGWITSTTMTVSSSPTVTSVSTKTAARYLINVDHLLPQNYHHQYQWWNCFAVTQSSYLSQSMLGISAFSSAMVMGLYIAVELRLSEAGDILKATFISKSKILSAACATLLWYYSAVWIAMIREENNEEERENARM